MHTHTDAHAHTHTHTQTENQPRPSSKSHPHKLAHILADSCNLPLKLISFLLRISKVFRLTNSFVMFQLILMKLELKEPNVTFIIFFFSYSWALWTLLIDPGVKGGLMRRFSWCWAGAKWEVTLFNLNLHTNNITIHTFIIIPQS